VRIAYADPPYPGCAHMYKDHPDYAGEVDHAELLTQLSMYDGWLLHTSSVALPDIIPLVPNWEGVRIMPWVKTFAAFKPNVPVAYAWEPVLVKACRKPVVSGRAVMRDWIAAPITMKRGLVGVKPDMVCRWAFEVLGMEPADELLDLFPGSGAVTHAWERWRSEMRLAV
jgi:hypothetical protein